MESKRLFLILSHFLLILFGIIICEKNLVFTHLLIIVKVGNY